MRTDSLKLPLVSSEYLFRLLARRFRVDLVCDVGAFDCMHSKRFHAAGFRVVALEADPRNFAALASDSTLRDAGIDVLHIAATNYDGEARLHAVKAPEGSEIEWFGAISSLRERASEYPCDGESVTVPSIRLDTLIERLRPTPARVALWIDVEGCAYEVIEGLRRVAGLVSVVHVEVEAHAFWDGQHLWQDVVELMGQLGFAAIARRPGDTQFDVVFVATRRRQLVSWDVRKAWIRHRIGRVYRWFRSILRSEPPRRHTRSS